MGQTDRKDGIPFGLLFAERAIPGDNPIVGYDHKNQVGVYAKGEPQDLSATITSTTTAFNDQDHDQ